MLDKNMSCCVHLWCKKFHVVFLVAPLFVVQWLFDEEQLRVENIYMGGQHMSQEQWQYIQNLGRELKNSLSDVTYGHKNFVTMTLVNDQCK